MTSLFRKTIPYDEDALNLICDTHNLVITDCIKDDQEITISDDSEGEPIWVFSLVKGYYLTFDRTFRLTWQDDDYLNKTSTTNQPVTNF